MSTNILSMPLAAIVFENGNNEDWIDSLLFLVPDGGTDPSIYPQLDLRGIEFEMEVRNRAEDHEVLINASTTNGLLKVGDYPNYGYLLIGIDIEVMRQQMAGDYVGDVVASDPSFTRRVITFDLTLVEGVTR
jgi:hypothetical protein